MCATSRGPVRSARQKTWSAVGSAHYDGHVQHFQHAARALGWHGPLVTDVEVLGTRFAAATRIRPEVHRWRSEHGWAPELNPSWFQSEPDEHDRIPVPAVELDGLLVPVSRARYGLEACGTLMTLAPCAVVLPAGHPYRPWPVLELDYYGIGVVTAGNDEPAELVLAPEDRTAEFGSSPFGRWLLEVLYSKLLDQQNNPRPAENA